MAKNGTEAYISELPDCQFAHTLTNRPKAEYDFRTTDGRWGYGCDRHWRMHRLHTELGLGKGQKLVVKSTKSTVPPNEHDSSDLV